MYGLLFKLAPYIIGAIIIASLVWVVNSHFNEFERLKAAEITLSEDLIILEGQYATEQINHAKTKTSFIKYQNDVQSNIQTLQTDLKVMSNKFQQSEERKNELSKLLGRHNLSHLAAERPASISRLSTAATARLFNRLNERTSAGATRSTGSPGQ